MENKKMPVKGHNPRTGDTQNNVLDYPTGQRPGKDFETLRAAFALRGHALHRGHPEGGEPTFWVERWGLARHLPSIDAARRFLEAIGGRL